MATSAEQFAAALDNDGQQFTTADGIEFDELAEQMGATVEFSKRVHSEPGLWDDGISYETGSQQEHIADDPIRYVFPDGSAVVSAGAAWDIEGGDPFSWSGA